MPSVNHPAAAIDRPDAAKIRHLAGKRKTDTIQNGLVGLTICSPRARALDGDRDVKLPQFLASSYFLAILVMVLPLF